MSRRNQHQNKIIKRKKIVLKKKNRKNQNKQMNKVQHDDPIDYGLGTSLVYKIEQFLALLG